jgi:hypothetical protein
LSDSELRERGDSLAVFQGHIEAYEGNKKADAEHWNTKIKSERASMERVAKQIRDRQAIRAVEVRELVTPESGEVALTRTDTGVVLSIRRWTDEERQRSMFPVELAAIGAAVAASGADIAPPPDSALAPDPIDGLDDGWEKV